MASGDDGFEVLPYSDFPSDADMAIVQVLAQKNKHRRPFYYRLCDSCRHYMTGRDPFTNIHRWRDEHSANGQSFYKPEESGYFAVAEQMFGEEKEKYLEVKRICRGAAIREMRAAPIRRSIERHMRRKKLSEREQVFFTTLLAGTKLKALR